jgi:hypothetical protein
LDFPSTATWTVAHASSTDRFSLPSRPPVTPSTIASTVSDDSPLSSTEGLRSRDDIETKP